MPEKNAIKMCVVTTIATTMKGLLVDQLLFLSKNGFEITVICSGDDDLLANCPQGLTYYPVHMARSASPFSSLIGCVRLWRYFYKNKFDIVQYTTPKAAFLASIASWLTRVPVRLYCQWGIRYVTMQGLQKVFYKQIEKLTCNFSTHVTPDGFENREFAIAERLYDEEKSSVVHYGSANGVNFGKFNYNMRDNWRAEIREELGIDSDSCVCGWVGRVTRDKGVLELITAFLNVLPEAPAEMFLLMIGDMEKNHGLSEELLNVIDTHPNIRYVGPKDRIEKYYAAMDVLIAPSYREGFAMVAVEAQAMGIPVILSDIPGLRETLMPGVTGILAPVKEVDLLADAMKQLVFNTELRKLMGEKAVVWVRQRFEQAELWTKVLEHRRTLIGA